MLIFRFLVSSLSSMLVIKYPLMTKKKLTPRPGKGRVKRSTIFLIRSMGLAECSV